MVLPIKNNGYYRKFGEKAENSIHLGVDYKANIGDEVKAIADGIVLDSREIMGFGGLNPPIVGGTIFIQHNDIVCLYGHINRAVMTGDKITEGQVIGNVRDFTNKDKVNGFYHAPHLHFGIWNQDKMPPAPFGYNPNIGLWIDSIKFFQDKGVTK